MKRNVLRGRSRVAAPAPPATVLLDEAVHLVRLVPVGLLVTYYLGTLPFLIALVDFWVDMTRSPFASAHAAPGALAVAVLFLWMKAFQAAYCRRLSLIRSGDAGAAAARLGAGGWLRLAARQAVVHAVGMVVLPAALAATVPAAWAYAFFHSFSVLGRGERTLREEVAAAEREALRWPAQGHVLALSILLLLVVVFANVGVVLALLPFVAKSLLGVESTVTRSPALLGSTTFLAVVACVTYALVDPIARAAYVLRCFHGVSVRSGLDLRAAVAGLADADAGRPGVGATATVAAESRRAPAAAAVVLVCVHAFLAAPASRAVDAVSPAPPLPTAGAPGADGGAKAASLEAPMVPVRGEDARGVDARGVDARALDQAVAQVLERPEFAWRTARDAPLPDDQVGWPERILRAIGRGLVRVGRFVGRVVRALAEWLRAILPEPDPGRRVPELSGLRRVARGLGYALLALSLALVAVLVRRVAVRRPAAVALPPPAVAAVPDVHDEAVTADQLPEDGWLALARDLLGRGERRAGVRALYLAGLAHLAARDALVLARHKSNRDYRAELDRRERARPELGAGFAVLVAAFERVWYGAHPPSEALVGEAESGLARIRSRA